MDWSPKANETKINNGYLIQRVYTERKITDKIKRQLIEWEKIFDNMINKVLMSKIDKYFIQLISKTNKQTSNWVKKWAEGLNRHFPKEDIK